MKVVKLLPYGFCYGVINAYNKSIEILKSNKDKDVYILGWLVHNKNVIDELIELGAIILDDKKQTRYELINSIPNNSIVILSAHGTSYNVFELMDKKNITYYDLTCKYVYKTHNLIKGKINDGYRILFIGKKNHPETNTILSISEQIILIESITDVDNILLNNNQKIFCTNQTTLGIFDYQKIINYLKNKIPNIEIINDICDATTLRQQAIINYKNDLNIKICFVIGDKRSSNCNELLKLAKTKFENVYMINSLEEINSEIMLNHEYCAITAAASTPKKVIDEIVLFLEKNKKIS